MNYFLLDANVLVAYYCSDEPTAIRTRATSLFSARSQKKAFLYVPNICIAEVLRAFAKKCWKEKMFGEPRKAFDKFRDAFLDDIKRGKVLYSIELARRHILMTDGIYERVASISFRQGTMPSAFDVLLIAMGCDLKTIHHPSRFSIVTAERPIFDVCRKADDLPHVINITENDIPADMLS